MEDFLKKYSNLPKDFIRDFYNITKEEYADDQFIIDFDIVYKWLQVRKDNLKRIIVSNFSKNYDYTSEIKKIIKKDGGATRKEIIMLTPDCFKELCMLSQTEKANEVRKYFLEMEKLVRKYYKELQEKVLKEFELVKKNQKPKVKNTILKKGKIYVIQAQNTEMTLYKLGKSKDMDQRIKNYNTGNANDIDILLEVDVDDINNVELCVKREAKLLQYRKYKEVYEASADMLESLIKECDEFLGKVKKLYENHKKKMKKNIARMKEDKKLFIYVSKN